jgi:hypothetical protein
VKLSAERIARIRYGWFSDRLYDLVETAVPAPWGDRAIDFVEKVTERPIIDRILPRICAHDEALLECRDPLLWVCRGCDETMPGEAPRRRVSEQA